MCTCFIVGALVLAENPETGEQEYKEVVQAFENETNELVHLTVNSEEIVTTPKHLFYVPQRGWISAIDLKAGDILVLSNGEYVTVEQVQNEILETTVKVYNFEVEDFHTYYVGENSVLVHNLGCETFIRYGSKEEAIASSEANALLPKELNGKTTRSVKWISEQGKARNYKALGKGHDYKMTIVTKPGAKKWLADHSKPTDFNCNESDYMKFVMINVSSMKK